MADFSLTSFAAFATGLAVEIDKAQRHAIEKAAVMIETEAKRVIGQYADGYDWPQLADATQEERARLGFPPNEPLLRTGEMRDSIEHTIISSREAEVGSDSDIAVYQELGTSKIPPRSFLVQAAIHKEEDIVRMIGGQTVKALSSEAGIKEWIDENK
jgi:hypothetical protein